MPRRRRNKNKNLQKEEDTSAGKNNNNNNNNNINVDDDEEEVDKISKLPDDVLILIISWLTVAEAVRTSILSTRWRGLHTYITRLDFSDTLKQLEIIPCVEDSEEEKEQQQQQVEEDLEKEEHLKEEEEEEEVVKETECYKFVKKYASIIDHTLDTHNGGAILQEFRLHIPCYTYQYYDDNDQSTCPKKRCLIQKWLEFAFLKQVLIIHVRLDCSHRWALFPFFSSKNETLKELSLNSVDVDDEFLDLLLLNFVALERLSIERSYRLSVVRLLGDLLVALKLKHFGISECCGIKSVEIRDMTNLESLTLHQLPHRYKIENVPSLVDLDTCKNMGIQILSQGIISDQLVKLKLSSDPYHDFSYDDVDDMRLPKLVKIKHMELQYSIRDDRNIRELFHFIEACPYLQKLRIRFVWHKCPSNYMWDSSARYRIKAVTKTSYDHLKRVELVGLFGCPREYEFGSCIIGKATALEEMFAETRAYDNVIMERKAISRVWKYFRRKLPKSVNLVVE